MIRAMAPRWERCAAVKGRKTVLRIHSINFIVRSYVLQQDGLGILVLDKLED